MNLQISFNGSLVGVGTDCGYGYAAVQLIKAWQNQGVEVWWAKEEAPVSFSFCQPGYYSWQRDDQYKIGYTAWESTTIPDGWAHHMNNMDEIWATSEAVAGWFKEGGVKVPIRVFPHGVNADHWPPRLRRLAEGDVFKFLHVGEPTPRKGGEMAYRAFKKVYGNSPDFSLTLKGTPRFDIKGDNVKVIKDRLTQEEMTELYLDHHAMIYPTNGEGFGLIPFQAMATGMPTAVTDWGGPQNYISAGEPITVKSLIEADYDPHEGLWAAPDFDNTCLWYEYFGASPKYFFGKAFRKAKALQVNYDWNTLAKLSISWIKEGVKR